MTFGSVVTAGHDKGRPILPKRDVAVESSRPPIPPVPRAPRAKAKSNSRGQMDREVKSQQPDNAARGRPSMSMSSSELRRPREESPFTYARSHSLSREDARSENQQFMMGPTRESDERTNFRRGRGQPEMDNQPRSGSCPPWSVAAAPETGAEGVWQEGRSYARQRTLQRERQAADQGLEWVTEHGADSEPQTHARRRVLEREEDGPTIQAASRPETFSRVLCRHGQVPPDNVEDDSLKVGRRNVLQAEAKGTSREDSYSRVMGR